ncbi:hypothetical protein Baya_13413 [Bagarius yarrelli]|uniref:Uncharacterized protein n=1 Tax=Bagarius yarrelli TaxID=175774 RepID=A0A556V5K0_BAGYA|nr:hypothetical protein Baya_13413 [Bagarius yarrelli]
MYCTSPNRATDTHSYTNTHRGPSACCSEAKWVPVVLRSPVCHASLVPAKWLQSGHRRQQIRLGLSQGYGLPGEKRSAVGADVIALPVKPHTRVCEEVINRRGRSHVYVSSSRAVDVSLGTKKSGFRAHPSKRTPECLYVHSGTNKKKENAKTARRARRFTGYAGQQRNWGLSIQLMLNNREGSCGEHKWPEGDVIPRDADYFLQVGALSGCACEKDIRVFMSEEEEEEKDEEESTQGWMSLA